MTEREEQAVVVLNTLHDNPLLSDIHRQALEVGIMAIKALSSSEKPNTCGDAVSRQAVLEAIEDDRRNGNYSCFASNNDAECFKQIISELPSVTPQQRTGRWEWVQYDYNPKLGNWHCSECRSVVMECVDKNEKSYIPLYKYCPQCGCKMEVEE